MAAPRLPETRSVSIDVHTGFSGSGAGGDARPEIGTPWCARSLCQRVCLLVREVVEPSPGLPRFVGAAEARGCFCDGGECVGRPRVEPERPLSHGDGALRVPAAGLDARFERLVERGKRAFTPLQGREGALGLIEQRIVRAAARRSHGGEGVREANQGALRVGRQGVLGEEYAAIRVPASRRRARACGAEFRLEHRSRLELLERVERLIDVARAGERAGPEDAVLGTRVRAHAVDGGDCVPVPPFVDPRRDIEQRWKGRILPWAGRPERIRFGVWGTVSRGGCPLGRAAEGFGTR